MKKNIENEQEWTEEGYERFLQEHPDYPEAKDIDCLNLLLKRENALAIISGEKRIEFRAYTQHYVDRLYDGATEDFVERHKNEPDVLFWCDTLRLVRSIHFHDRGNTWSLDVECTHNDVIWPTDENVKYLHEEYGCHEMDALNRKLNREGATNRPMYFYFELGKIINRKNI